MNLELNGIEVRCIIGERPEERLMPQTLRVDVSLEIPDRAAETDKLADTIDYADLTERIRETLVAAKVYLIERAARVVAETCRTDPRVRSVRVRVTKTGAIPYLTSATCSLTVPSPSRNDIRETI